MGTCSVCSGMCYLPSGRYEDCYSCGGRGYGATTDTACMACGGSGKSTAEIKDACWNCSGTGTVSSPSSSVSSNHRQNVEKTSSGTPKTNATKKQSSVSESIGGLSVLIAIIACLVTYGKNKDIGETIVAGIIAFFASGAALYIAYYVLKLAVEVLKVVLIVAFWGFIALVVAKALGFEWASEIISEFSEIISQL